MPAAQTRHRPLGVAWWLVGAGAVGLVAAFALTIEKLLTLADPSHVPSCNFSILVGCSTNLASEAGALFGFPNPLIGLVAWPVVITVGVTILAGARLPRWFWGAFALGVSAALVFVIFLIIQSVYVIDSLCPWCMLTWAVTIPTFWVVVLHALRTGAIPAGARARRGAGAASGWIPLITFGCFLIIAALAQLELDAFNRLTL